MSINFLGKSFLTLLDYSTEEIHFFLDTAAQLKDKKKKKIKGDLLEGKNLVLIFEKTSTRTRCSFEVGMMDEGGGVTMLGMNDSQVSKKESIEDTAKVLGRIYDGIEFRGYKQSTAKALAKHSGVPVFNGLTDLDHPTQALADFLTIREHINKPLDQIKVVFVGDSKNNVANALMICSAKLGANYAAYAPKECFPDDDVLKMVKDIAASTGSEITVSSNAEEALAGADVIYTDIWISMGEETLVEEKVKLLSPYKITMELLKKTGNADVIFMHCLPAFHDMETTYAKKMKEEYGLDICEVSDEVFRSKHSVVFDQAENRLHTIKAVLVTAMSEKFYSEK